MLWIVAVAPAASASQCDLNSVTGTTVNKSVDALTLDSASHGVTNVWCNVPDKHLRPGETDKWKVGDNLFSTEMFISYAAPNHDSISLRATMFAFTNGDARCSVTPNGNGPSPYRCTAESTFDPSGGNNVNRVTFTISKK